MIHLGDITKINGAEIPPVDVITGGSPCQDLSVAGKRAGLDGERSGLFMEQIRITKEMRDATKNDNREPLPRYMVWENVPGAFSSGTPKGEDFRIVLEETAKVADSAAVIPRPKDGRWSKSGAIVGDGWSIAWRVHDAQFWGVPQRRKRIALVADFGGESAPEILFERKGLRRDSEQSVQKREELASRTEGSIGAASWTLKIRGGREIDSSGKRAGKGALVQTEMSGTIGVVQDQTLVQVYERHDQDARYKLFDSVCETVSTKYGTGGGNMPIALEEKDSIKIVRRLTPLECTRLQGFPDGWVDIGDWIDSKGKKHKDGDSQKYKALGNSIAVPYWKVLARRIAAQYDRDITMGSLFDGIGGFPLAFEHCGAKPVWASEIEEFCIAVTKHHFSEETEV